MPDPALIPDAADIAKVGGGGAIASLFTLMAGRLFGGQDKVLARLDVMQATISSLASQMAVLVATSERRDMDVSRLQDIVAAHEKTLARIEAMLERLSEGN